MPQSCRTCAHPDLDEITVALGGGDSVRSVADAHGLSWDSVSSHKKNHLTPAMVRLATQRRHEGSAWSAYDTLQSLFDRASDLMDRAEAKGSIVGGAQVIRELRQIVETLAKLTGELNEQPTVTVNVLSSPEVIDLVDRLLSALVPYPEARVAAAAALDVVDAEVVA